MKDGIHPTVHDVVFVDTSSGAQFISQSTLKSEETIKIGGKEYYVIKVEVTSDTHPFYTGKQKLLDSAGRVDKFQAKMAKAKQYQAEQDKKAAELEDDEDIAPRTPKKEQKVAEKVEVEPEVVAEVVAEAEVTEEENSEGPQTEDDKPSKKAEKEQAEADEELDAFEDAA